MTEKHSFVTFQVEADDDKKPKDKLFKNSFVKRVTDVKDLDQVSKFLNANANRYIEKLQNQKSDLDKHTKIMLSEIEGDLADLARKEKS